MYGISMEHVWHMYGIGMEYVWNMYGISMEYAWHMYGISMEYVWNMYGTWALPRGHFCYPEVASKRVEHNANVEYGHSRGVTLVTPMSPESV